MGIIEHGNMKPARTSKKVGGWFGKGLVTLFFLAGAPAFLMTSWVGSKRGGSYALVLGKQGANYAYASLPKWIQGTFFNFGPYVGPGYGPGFVLISNDGSYTTYQGARIKAVMPISPNYRRKSRYIVTSEFGCRFPLGSWPRKMYSAVDVVGQGASACKLLGYRSMHYGLDIRAKTGTPHFAGVDGAVKYVGSSGRCGKMVEIWVNGQQQMFVRYCHLDTFAPGLAKGQRIRKSDRIGTVGTSGHSSGAHVHMAVRVRQVNGKYRAVDPRVILPEFQEVGGGPRISLRRAIASGYTFMHYMIGRMLASERGQAGAFERPLALATILNRFFKWAHPTTSQVCKRKSTGSYRVLKEGCDYYKRGTTLFQMLVGYKRNYFGPQEERSAKRPYSTALAPRHRDLALVKAMLEGYLADPTRAFGGVTHFMHAVSHDRRMVQEYLLYRARKISDPDAKQDELRRVRGIVRSPDLLREYYTQVPYHPLKKRGGWTAGHIEKYWTYRKGVLCPSFYRKGNERYGYRQYITYRQFRPEWLRKLFTRKSEVRFHPKKRGAVISRWADVSRYGGKRITQRLVKLDKQYCRGIPLEAFAISTDTIIPAKRLELLRTPNYAKRVTMAQNIVATHWGNVWCRTYVLRNGRKQLCKWRCKTYPRRKVCY